MMIEKKLKKEQILIILYVLNIVFLLLNSLLFVYSFKINIYNDFETIDNNSKVQTLFDENIIFEVEILNLSYELLFENIINEQLEPDVYFKVLFVETITLLRINLNFSENLRILDFNISEINFRHTKTNYTVSHYVDDIHYYSNTIEFNVLFDTENLLYFIENY